MANDVRMALAGLLRKAEAGARARMCCARECGPGLR